MLAIPFEQQRIVEKVVRARDGRLLRVCVAMSFSDGQWRGRILSVQPVQELHASRFTLHDLRPCCLPAPKAAASECTSELPVSEYVSPYFSKLEFFVSQMTRAPSRA